MYAVKQSRIASSCKLCARVLEFFEHLIISC